MTESFERDSSAARTALLLHFLFEALHLHLLPPGLAETVAALASAVEAHDDLPPRAAVVESAFLDCREQSGLADLAWPAAGDQAITWAAEPALAQTSGVATHRAAAERLGRFCEQLSNQAKDRRASGSYYTPGWAADAIAQTLVFGVLRGRGRPGAALSLTVLDPAAGAGAFPVAAVEAIAHAAGEGEDDNDIRRAAARDCIFATEMDPLAAEACRLALWLSASRPGRTAALPAHHIQIGDALAEPPPPGAFDIVLGNPPWGVKLSADQAAALSLAAPYALAGHRDSFLYFLHLAQHAARDDGAIGMLVPDVLLWQVRYQAMRRALLDRFRPLRIVLLGERIFPGATAPACLLCLAGRDLAPDRFDTSDLRRAPRGHLSREVTTMGWLVSRDAPITAPHCSFLNPPEWLGDLLSRLGSRGRTLADLGERFTFHDAGINYPRADLGRRVLYTGPREHPRDIPLVRGRDFKALSAIGSSAWLRHDWRERVHPGDGVSVREPTYRLTPKLLLRQTADRPVATIDRRGVYFGRSVIAVSARSERDLLWLAALLNSTPFAALYRALTPEAGRAFAQVKVNKLKLVPAPGVGEDCLAELAAQILAETAASARLPLFAKLDDEAARAYGLTEAEAAALKDALRPAATAGRSRRTPPAGTS